MLFSHLPVSVIESFPEPNYSRAYLKIWLSILIGLLLLIDYTSLNWLLTINSNLLYCEIISRPKYLIWKSRRTVDLVNLQITLRKERVVMSIHWEVKVEPFQVTFLSDLSQQGFMLLSVNCTEVIKKWMKEWKTERKWGHFWTYFYLSTECYLYRPSIMLLSKICEAVNIFFNE